jgi:hypothetical protein
MKDLRPEEDVELIEMKVPIGNSPRDYVDVDAKEEDEPQDMGEEAPPPAPFEFHNWDD